MLMKIDPRKIRIWSKNPRYTNYKDIDFQKIGEDNFEISPFNEIRDVYYDKLKNNYLELINNYEKLKSMIGLLESLSDGFNPNIDEIIITYSPFLSKNKIFNKNEHYYYSLEGNRRIFALNILLNTKDTLTNGEILETRKIIYNFISEKHPKFLKQFNNIVQNFDNSKINFNEIEVKTLNVGNHSDDEIWKTLNARHFGKRKGKMNWPRGLVLSAINEKIEKIRQDLKLSINEEIDDNNFKKTIKNLENFTGKEISIRDLQMSLWTTYCSKVYNSQKDIQEIEKISYIDTEEEGNEINDDSIENMNIKDSEGNLNNEEKKVFKISSLELSMSTIKILSYEGIHETLSKIIDLKIDTKKWMVEAKKISKNVLENLIIYIINLIKNKKLNTRYFDQNYENEIKEIISLKDNDKEQLNYLIKKNINKISPKFAPLSLLIKEGYEENLDFSKYSEDEKQNYLKKTKSIITNIIPILNKMIALEGIWKNEIKSLNNDYQYGLITIWITELNSILKNKEVTSIWNFPLLLFSSALRTTSELLMLMLIEKSITNDFFNDKLTNKKDLDDRSFKTLNSIDGKFSNKIEGWIQSTKSFEIFTTPFIKEVYKTFFNDLNGHGFALKELENYLEDISKKRPDSKNKDFLNELSKDLVNFINWSIELSEKQGMSDILNALIHTPSLIKSIHDDSNEFTNLSNEFDKKINVVIKLIEFILE